MPWICCRHSTRLAMPNCPCTWNRSSRRLSSLRAFTCLTWCARQDLRRHPPRRRPAIPAEQLLVRPTTPLPCCPRLPRLRPNPKGSCCMNATWSDPTSLNRSSQRSRHDPARRATRRGLLPGTPPCRPTPASVSPPGPTTCRTCRSRSPATPKRCCWTPRSSQARRSWSTS